MFALEQTAARGLKVTVRDPAGELVELVGTPFHIAGADLPLPQMPPLLGQHTDAILRDLLNLPPDEIDRLRRARVV
jgi:crotonobetainyl-CoA:carnitine CoA-transferase CaiB-like acyl-CoA transferase